MPGRFTLNPGEEVFAHRTESTLAGGSLTHSAMCLSRNRLVTDAENEPWLDCFNHGLNTPEGQFPYRSLGSGKAPTSTFLGTVNKDQLQALEKAHVNRGRYNLLTNNCWQYTNRLASLLGDTK